MRQPVTKLGEATRRLAHGIQMGSSEAKVQIIEFADFECPFCERMHSALSELRRRWPADIAVTFVHSPLEQHRFAEIASRAGECAGQQGRFEDMHDVLFRSQREFGITPWVDLAHEAGVRSNADFENCMQSSSPMQRVIQGKRLARQLDIGGTPTLSVNGWQLAGPPTLDELEVMVNRILAGKDPVNE